MFYSTSIHIFKLGIGVIFLQGVISLSSPNNNAASRKYLPSNSNGGVIKCAARCISQAFVEDGIHHQVIRLPLSESMYASKEERFVADRAIGWQGGATETLRYLSPIVSELLKEIKTMTKEKENSGGLVPKVSSQILLDFDGSSLMTAENPAGALYDVQALLQPNTDNYYLKTIASIEEQFSNTSGKDKRLFLLVNPAWKDKSSWGFFGGKKAQALILDRYETTFAIDQFVVRGQQVSLYKSYSNDWIMYLRNDPYQPMTDSTIVTSFQNNNGRRPSYEAIDQALLNFDKLQQKQQKAK
mmetsp:Transcript_60396/g.69399  ORF Transcript_60396/g.69399 Transcript_60396/m.69399 type:complete len:299 (-) Transcript_60396:2-898(-)